MTTNSESKPLLENRDKSKDELQHEMLGYSLIMGSGLFFESMDYIVRYITAYAGVSANNIVLLRGGVQTVLALLITVV